MFEFFLAVIGLVFLASSTGFLASSKKARKSVLERLCLSRKPIGSFKPPRLLSHEKNGLSANRPDYPEYPEYPDVFPPSRRHALANLPEGAMKGAGKPTRELAEQAPDYSRRVPNNVKADAPDMWDHVTATGFTVEEIKRLGDFPDYATLSGVPLPQPYKDFDIANAQPRPYRPLRWPYHQTMCRLKKIIHMSDETYDEAQLLLRWSRTGGLSSRIPTSIGSKSGLISSTNTVRWCCSNCLAQSLPRRS